MTPGLPRARQRLLHLTPDKGLPVIEQAFNGSPQPVSATTHRAASRQRSSSRPQAHRRRRPSLSLKPPSADPAVPARADLVDSEAAKQGGKSWPPGIPLIEVNVIGLAPVPTASSARCSHDDGPAPGGARPLSVASSTWAGRFLDVQGLAGVTPPRMSRSRRPGLPWLLVPPPPHGCRGSEVRRVPAGVGHATGPP